MTTWHNTHQPSPLLHLRPTSPEQPVERPSGSLGESGAASERAVRGADLVGEREVSALVELAWGRGARVVAVGAGREGGAVDGVRAVVEAWEAVGGEVALELSWPERAASWLRQARRFAAADAEVWIMLGPPLGWAQMTRRLLWSTPWNPARTLLAGEISDPSVLNLVGLHNLPGIAGVTRDGTPWHEATPGADR
ncbi:hypothetical protein [Kribbella sp.]|uniref:hypothetical protein n=1 Tax=Kribbella sp. TaxID=1871183 RepID=UPI002D586713|nr:hypothetical protein [Kribbella sp.]HZX01457.1 hypothetical protein [Kribbella sp.]